MVEGTDSKKNILYVITQLASDTTETWTQLDPEVLVPNTPNSKGLLAIKIALIIQRQNIL